MKRLLLIPVIFFSAAVFAQPSDFLVLKKKGRTVKTYFTGSQINFTSSTGATVEAFITAIQNDTLFLKGFVIRQLPTQLGVYVLDTNYYYSQYHYKQIVSFEKLGRRFDWSGSGAALFGGGILLCIANAVVYLADNKKFSPELLGAAAGLTGLGYLLLKTSGKGMKIGKNYSLVYVNAAEKKG
jgi:hypothetical protein